METEPPLGGPDALQKVAACLNKQRILQYRDFKNWEVTAYFGPVPDLGQEAATRLEFTASATTPSKTDSVQPDLSDSKAVCIDFDERSVIWWSGSSLEEVTTKIINTFPGFSWDTKETT